MIRQYPLLVAVEEFVSRDWMNDEVTLANPEELLAVAVGYAILGRSRELENVSFPVSQGAFGTFEADLWNRLTRGQPMSTHPLSLGGLKLARKEDLCLLAVAALSACPPAEQNEARQSLLRECPLTSVQQDHLLEGFYWSRGSRDESDFPALAAALVESLDRPSAAICLGSWALQFVESRQHDFAELTHETLAKIDADLFGEVGGSRVNDGPFAATVESGRIEIRTALEGTGGPLGAAWALAMRPVSHSVAGYVARLLAGLLDVKKVKGVRSAADLKRKLTPSCQIDVHLQLKGELSVADADLDPCRNRLEFSVEWLRMQHPELAAGATLSVSR